MDPPPQWPKYGEIIFANVWFKYQPEGEDGGQVGGPFARFKVLMESRSNGNLCNQCKYQCAPASSISLTSLIYDCYVLWVHRAHLRFQLQFCNRWPDLERFEFPRARRREGRSRWEQTHSWSPSSWPFFHKRDILSIPFIPFGLTYYYFLLEARREMDTSMKSSMLFLYINVNMFVFFYHSGPYRSGQV